MTNGSDSCAWGRSSRRICRSSAVRRRSPGAPESGAGAVRSRLRPATGADGRRPGAASALRWLLLFALTLASLGGCGADLGPDEVAIRFWSAVITGDAGQARAHVRAGETVELATDLLPVTAFEVGRYTVDGERATVATRLHLEEEGRVLVLPVDTVLVREDGAWRVDYAASTALASREGELGRMLSGIRQFSDLLKRGIERSTDELERTLPRLERELSGLEGEIRRQLPELRRRLERFEQELRKAIEPPPAAPEPIEI